MKIAAVVVTFNRVFLLQECLSGLLRQTRPLDAIFVIDNNSSDSTESMMRELTKENGSIVYLRQKENLGGAGGFHVGAKTAYESGYDWIWMMDDDVEPYSDALAGLLSYSDRSLCIHGQRTNPDGTVFPWGATFNESTGLAKSFKYDFKSSRDFCLVSVGCFEGMLIHRSVVEKIGFPDSRFFISWDDTIYGYLASKWTDVIYAAQLSLMRKRQLTTYDLGIRRFQEVSDLYRYHYIKNRRYIREYLKKNPKFSWFLYDTVTVILTLKEIFRAVVLQRKPGSVLVIWRAVKTLF